MRSLFRNKQTFYYALYGSETDVIDSNGNLTGEKSLTYDNIVEMRANIAPVTGTALIEQFGIDSRYSRLISTTDMDCPLAETSVLWIGIPTTDAPNYKVVAVRRSINSVRILVTEIQRGKPVA